MRHGPEIVVCVDDQRREQVVTAGEVAVDRRADHAQVAGDAAQRQSRRTAPSQLGAGEVLDLRSQLGTHTLRATAHLADGTTATATSAFEVKR